LIGRTLVAWIECQLTAKQRGPAKQLLRSGALPASWLRHRLTASAVHCRSDKLVGKGVVINGLPIIVTSPEYIFFRHNLPNGSTYTIAGTSSAATAVIESIGFDNFKQAR